MQGNRYDKSPKNKVDGILKVLLKFEARIAWKRIE